MITKYLAAILLFTSMVWAQTPASHQVSMKWNASTTPGVRYRVYRSQKNGGPYKVIKGSVGVTSYKDTTVVPGTYYYVTTAFYYPKCVNKYGSPCESIDSNQITAVVP
jgi:hypothetical protein